MAKKAELGTNVEYKLEGNILTLTIDLSQRQGASKSGKTVVIATTSGNQLIPHESGAIIGVNCYTKIK